MSDKLKSLLNKAEFGIAEWRGGRIPVCNVRSDHSNGNKVNFGVTLSGGEFTPGGTYPQNYSYPPAASVDYYANIGMKWIRLPILWERIQTAPYSGLDHVEMVDRIHPIVSYAISRGLKVGIDLHNSGYWNGYIIGNKECPDAYFADVWGKIAAFYKEHGDDVFFMLMSEPHDQTEFQWIATANAAIAAIRAAGAAQKIVVPATCYSGAWLWDLSLNAKVVGGGVVDPLNNYTFELHQYLDTDGSGGTAGIVRRTIGADRLAAVTRWARARGVRLVLGEFGTGSDPVSMQALTDMLVYLTANADVWEYVAWWGGGSVWTNYFMASDPADYDKPIDKPQMALLRKYVGL